MPRRRVVVIAGGGPGYAGFARLEAIGIEVVPRLDLRGSGSETAVIRALDGVWGVIAGNEPYTERVLKSTPSLRVIARPGVGYDAVDVAAAARRGVVVFTTPGINGETVADFTILLMLGCLRHLPLVDHMVRSGEWQPRGLDRDLVGSTVGVVGLGFVGQAVVRRLVAFGCTALASEPKPDKTFCEELDVTLMDFKDLLPVVDILTFHAPLNRQTYHLLGRPEMARMKRSAIVINTARGQIIDEVALVSALQDGTIAGAGLDVFETEPLPKGHPLARLDNVVLTGHVASHTSQTIERMLDAAVDGILDVVQGRVPVGCLNPEATAMRHD